MLGSRMYLGEIHLGELHNSHAHEATAKDRGRFERVRDTSANRCRR